MPKIYTVGTAREKTAATARVKAIDANLKALKHWSKGIADDNHPAILNAQELLNLAIAERERLEQPR